MHAGYYGRIEDGEGADSHQADEDGSSA